MPAPSTGGQLRTRIQDMQVGDYIICQYVNATIGQVGSFYNLGSDDTAIGESSLTGQPTGNRKFYFIKTDKGLLIADRVIQNNISWDVLNTKDMIQGLGVSVVFGDYAQTSHRFPPNSIIRSLGGGNSYATADGKSSTTDQGLGAWPVNNEWDEYIAKKDYGTGAGKDDVWHWSNVDTWIQETPSGNINGSKATNLDRIARKNIRSLSAYGSGATGSILGFRPVFEYQEVTP